MKDSQPGKGGWDSVALMKAVWLPVTADAGRAACDHPPSVFLLRPVTSRVAAAETVLFGQSQIVNPSSVLSSLIRK